MVPMDERTELPLCLSATEKSSNDTKKGTISILTLHRAEKNFNNTTDQRRNLTAKQKMYDFFCFHLKCSYLFYFLGNTAGCQ